MHNGKWGQRCGTLRRRLWRLMGEDSWFDFKIQGEKERSQFTKHDSQYNGLWRTQNTQSLSFTIHLHLSSHPCETTKPTLWQQRITKWQHYNIFAFKLQQQNRGQMYKNRGLKFKLRFFRCAPSGYCIC